MNYLDSKKRGKKYLDKIFAGHFEAQKQGREPTRVSMDPLVYSDLEAYLSSHGYNDGRVYKFDRVLGMKIKIHEASSAKRATVLRVA